MEGVLPGMRHSLGKSLESDMEWGERCIQPNTSDKEAGRQAWTGRERKQVRFKFPPFAQLHPSLQPHWNTVALQKPELPLPPCLYSCLLSLPIMSPLILVLKNSCSPSRTQGLCWLLCRNVPHITPTPGHRLLIPGPLGLPLSLTCFRTVACANRKVTVPSTSS